MAVKDKDLELDTDDEEAAPKKRSGAMKIILIVLGVLLLAGGAAGGALYFTGALSGGDDAALRVQNGPPLSDAAAEDGAKDTSKKAAAKKDKKKDAKPVEVFYHALEPAFVVNFEDQNYVRFLQVGVEIMTNDQKVIDNIDKHMPVIRNNILLLFGSQSYADISSREGKERLRQQTLAEIQGILKKYTGEKGVEEVYFTSFVMQ